MPTDPNSQPQLPLPLPFEWRDPLIPADQDDWSDEEDTEVDEDEDDEATFISKR